MMEPDLRRQSSAQSVHALGLQAFGAPASLLRGPEDVLASPALSHCEKRSILASWASDACAVESMPAWRCLPETGALVPLDDILSALHALDRGGLN